MARRAESNAATLQLSSDLQLPLPTNSVDTQEPSPHQPNDNARSSACGSDADGGADRGLELPRHAEQLAPEHYEVPYVVCVDGFERVRTARQGAGCTVFTLTIRHGNAHWPIRRRYQQIAALHDGLVRTLGSTDRAGLPKPPPKLTARSMVMGNFDQKFLQARCIELQAYLDSLLVYIPYVDQCECLREFLCTVDQRFLDDYERLLTLEAAIGDGGAGVELLDQSAIAALPRATKRGESCNENCVICQDALELEDDLQDVRRLPCGHQYHFNCIARWLEQSNSCCICQVVVEVPAAACDDA